MNEEIKTLDRLQILGEGTFCVVKEVKPQDGSTYFALKEPRTNLSLADLQEAQMHIHQEITILSQLNHPNIINFLWVYNIVFHGILNMICSRNH